MSHYVYAPKRDANHGEIVATYEALHCGVVDTHKLGDSFPDILVHFSGYCAPVEIKYEDGDLSAGQKKFIANWKGPKIWVVRTREDVIAHVTKIRSRFSQEPKA